MNNFVPQGEKVPHGATQLSMRPASGPNLGQHFAVGTGLPIPASPVGGPVQVPQGHSQAQVSAPTMPKGAQPVQLVASPHGPLAQEPLPRPSSALGAPQAAPPPQPLHGHEQDVYVIQAVGQGPDGRELVAEFDVMFPRGTKFLGVRY